VNCGSKVWSAFREPSFGHSLMDFLNDTTAVWNWQRNQDPIAAVNSDKVNALVCLMRCVDLARTLIISPQPKP